MSLATFAVGAVRFLDLVEEAVSSGLAQAELGGGGHGGLACPLVDYG
jgi:hypothetical protein